MRSGTQYVTCRVGELLVGISLDSVQEINRLTDPTFVPLMPPFLRGLINLRGNLVTVVDLGIVVRGTPIDASSRARTVVVELGDETHGLVVDAVGDVVDVAGLPIENLPSHLPAEQRRWFRGLVQLQDHLLLMLDLETLGSLSAETSKVGVR